MRSSHFLSFLVVAVLVIICWMLINRSSKKVVPFAPPTNAIRLDSLRWDDFLKQLSEPQNSKGTLVDVWATHCAPCRKNFHHLVELHEKYAPKGLRVISLSLDDRNDPAARSAALRFLNEKNATFTNILLDEESGVGYEKLNINAIPAVFLFGPDGNERQRFTLDDPNRQFTYEQVEESVAKFLEK